MITTKELENLAIIIPSPTKQQLITDLCEHSHREISLLRKLLSFKANLNKQLLDTFLKQEKSQ